MGTSIRIFFFKILSSLGLKMKSLTPWRRPGAPAARPRAVFWMEKILLREKRAVPMANLPFRGKMPLALTKMQKFSFSERCFVFFFLNSLHHF